MGVAVQWRPFAVSAFILVTILGVAGEQRSDSSLAAADFDVTLVTMTSVERVKLLELHCRRWKGPKIFTVYVERASLQSGTAWEERLLDLCGKSGDTTVLKVYKEPGSRAEFPVNRLRNEGILAVETSHFFYVDVDFLPSSAAYETVMRLIRENPKAFADMKMGFVVPAFQVKGDCHSVPDCVAAFEPKLPKDKSKLRQMFIARDVHIFDEPFSGHSSTNYKAWFHQGSKKIRPIYCLDSNRYEPYIITRKTQFLPLFDERFTGYGKNKIQWIIHLRYLGWAFTVLPDVFVVHLPHPKSASRKTWEDADKPSRQRQDMDHLYISFLKELSDVAHRQQKRTHLCSWVREQMREKNKAIAERKKQKQIQEERSGQ